MRIVGAMLLGILGGAVTALALTRVGDFLAIRMAADPYGVFCLLWLPMVAWTIGVFVASAIATSAAKRGTVVGVVSGLFVLLLFWVACVILDFPLWMVVSGLALQLILAFAAAWLFGRAHPGRYC